MNTLLHLARLSDRIVVAIGRASTWLALVLIAVILFDVVTRRFFVLGSTKLQELEWHIHTILFMFCVGFAYLSDDHVRIDLFRAKMSQRTQDWIELIGCVVFVIPYCGIILFLSIGFAYDSFVGGEVSSAGTGLSHRWIIKSCMTFGFALLLLSGICIALNRIVILLGPPELANLARQSASVHKTDLVATPDQPAEHVRTSPPTDSIADPSPQGKPRSSTDDPPN